MYMCAYYLVTQNLELVADKCGLSQESTAMDDSNYYSTVGSQPDIKHNGNVVYKVSRHFIQVINS